MLYHVRVSTRSRPNDDEVRLDLSRRELEERFLIPYREGRPIVIGGRTVVPDDLTRIRVTESDADSTKLLPAVRRKLSKSSGITFRPDEWHIAAECRDVTDDFITGPPGSTVHAVPRERRRQALTPNPKAVFVVHGRNMVARDAMFTFLRSLTLHPIEFNEAVRATGHPSPYVGDVLDRAFEMAQAVLILFTPDDEARLRASFRDVSDPAHETELTPQARPNVIFEAGMAMGRNTNRTVLVELGSVRPFSDIGGRHVLRMNNSTMRRQELAERLSAAECAVSLTGTDWHTAGDFGAALALGARSSPESEA